ncbi:MAG TPA: diacylglycerol kinase family protein [Jiangellales bacterium]|nr:diacylglycerol kinase family protein [Jiangellales bacterium]
MKALLRSFGYAFRGLYRATRTERNLRIHIVFMAYMYGFLLLPDWFTVTPVQWALLLLANALVVAAELLNTAVEAIVNLVTQGRYHQLAAVAKDTAAGGVLVCALFAVAVGVAVLWQPEAFRQMGAYYGTHPAMIGVLAISAGIAGTFIFSGRPSLDPKEAGSAVGSRIASVATDERGSAEPVP